MASASTVTQWRDWIEKAYLFFFVPIFSDSEKSRLLNPRKVYCVVHNSYLFTLNSKLLSFDGFIVDDLPSTRLARAFSRLRKPLVVLDWRDTASLRNRRKCVRIESDSKSIGILAAKTLLSIDQYSSFAYLPVAGSASWSEARGTAFKQELARHGQDLTVLNPTLPIINQVRRLANPWRFSLQTMSPLRDFSTGQKPRAFPFHRTLPFLALTTNA